MRHHDIYEIDSSIILQPGPAVLTDGVRKLQQILSQWCAKRNAKLGP